MLIKKGVVKAYCRLGNETLAAKEAGYKKFSFPCESGISAIKEIFFRRSQRVDYKSGTVQKELFPWRLK